MWIVRLALRRPYTFIVAAILLIILGITTIWSMATDIFPDIDIPVVNVVWIYSGVPPEEIEKRIVTISERAMTTTVNDIEHIESRSLNGVSVIKVFFHQNAKIEAAVAQITSVSQTILRVMPPGIQPPLIIRYSASSVPILQASLGSETLSEQALYDYGLNFIRTQLATVQGASVPLPAGGKPRQIMVDLDTQALYAKGLSATDVSNAINAQNLILPAGSIKIGDREYNVRLNSSTNVVDELNNLPIRQVNGATIYIRDVAHVRDGFAVQSNIVREDGRRSALLTILKSGSASTLDIVNRVKQVLPRIQSTLPPELNIKLLFDQSVFVRASLNGVVYEALIAACLTATMILLFLGSWRSTFIVAISIPLSILCSIIAMRALGETLNVMTLGGLALAVGILVDDATVEIENIHRNLGQSKPMDRAILDGAQQIAIPAFVSTLAICIVFVPIFFLSGSAKFLFSPLAEAVVFAMLASYILSRTLIPTLVKYLLRSEIGLFQHAEHEDEVLGSESKIKPDIFWRVHHWFNHYFERFRRAYRRALDWSLNHRRGVVVGFSLFTLLSFGLLPFIGQDFFPVVDAGQFRLQVRAPSGTRIEETEALFGEVEDVIRQIVPKNELETIIDNIGIPSGGVNLAFSDTVTIGPSDGEILVALKSDRHSSTLDIVKNLREELNTRFPQAEFFFRPADIVSQILNFGLPSPIDIQVSGPNQNQKQNYAIANQIKAEIAKIMGTVDVHVGQVLDNPELRVNVDRTRADQIGLTQRDVANSLLISLSSSGTVSPNYWLNPQNGVNYLVAVQTPQYKIDSLSALGNTPIVAGNQLPNDTTGTGNGAQLLNNLATTERQTAVANVSHYNVQPVYDVYANVQGRDLGGVLADVNRVIDQFRPKLPRGSGLVIRGQAESMRSSFLGLGAGLIFAAILIYCLMVVNFQSWLDPLIIMMALPGALSGILWMLFTSQTTINVPSLMGAIMSIGVATANSILLVTFANDQRLHGKDAFEAALDAGFVRLRPVLMTALAMIIGMLPMAIGLGEGGEQNAPLGRAVIGGLFVATVSTLFFVPVMYSLLRRKQPVTSEQRDKEIADNFDGGLIEAPGK